MTRAYIYMTTTCPYCTAAVALLQQLQIRHTVVELDGRHDLRAEISSAVGGWPTVPMVIIDGQFIGGYDDLAAWAIASST